MLPPVFTSEPLKTVLDWLQHALEQHGEARCWVPDPDAGHALHLYAGEVLPTAGIHRPYLSWLDAADLLDAHFLTPEKRADGPEGFVLLHFRRRVTPPADRTEGRYAAGSEFQRIDKLEDPHLLHDLNEALRRADLKPGARILSLGVGSGRELALLEQAYPGHTFEVLGLDIEPSALELARQRFPVPNWHFEQRDVRALPDAALGRFDLILALSLFQSPGLVIEDLLRGLRLGQLAAGGSFIVGFPNVRYRGQTLSYGARMLNFARPDLSLLMRDVITVRRHLQKHGFTVYVTGKYEVLITAVSRP
ncbi:methyltransferase domain-containing protein [Deinococcus sp. KNUC1210]|uniref:class I SAM-dependent methyltransferase n=1 Tax=Deinococcus sp. KNUC1210 TaxID=2917691 RepID=UPI001EF0424E|nr:class I SAM-dependent methyltransferase [Deinococcus sp. KNUC1210]ULH14651.1 methyltransferase domain-containing protein [Deinococcus sp. KNUC1210]